jgi:hypothetical protein|tara:strand:- start:1320 stop:2081 length:762 start_codon:yes stop_codon:yes gene_type:complete
MYFSKKLKKFNTINHCFFSKKNGVSKGIYSSLNCGLGSKDKIKNIKKNIKIVCKFIGCQENKLITLRQRHTNKTIYLTSSTKIKSKLIGDGIVTKERGFGIGILTADCIPIMFYDSEKKIIGCAHAGWKGTFSGIIQNTIRKFVKLGSKKKDIVCAIGPCIAKKNYTVKSNFYNKFIKKNKKNKKFFSSSKNEEYKFDLRNYANDILRNMNIKNIENIRIDTFSRKKSYFSYRRSLLNGDNDYGRCISIIFMK